MSYRIINADVKDMHGEADPGEGFDACFCDPPYGYSKPPTVEQMVEILTNWIAGKDAEHTGGGFMGKTWDSFVPGPATWRKVFDKMKPGAHLMAFAGPRTQDLMGISIRLAGFECRDTLMFLHGQGFPKGHRVDESVRRSLGEGGYCQCAASTHNSENTSRVPLGSDHNGTAALFPDSDRSLGDGPRSMNTEPDSPGDCRQDRRSHDGQPLLNREGDQSSPLSQGCAQERNH